MSQNKKPLTCHMGMAGLNFKHNRTDLCYRAVEGTFEKHKTFEDVMNDSELNRQRLMLRNGEWPLPQCLDCKQMEDKGATSYRNRIKLSDKADDWYVDNVDPETGKMNKLHRVEFRFSNVCNYACRHCSAEYSTLWTKTVRNNPDLKTFDINHLEHDTSYAQFLDLDTMIPYLEKLDDDEFLELEITGGEPFFQREFYECLIKFAPYAHKINLITTSNGSIAGKWKGYDVVEILKPYNSIGLKFSIDGSASFYDYFREGGNWDRVIKNILSLKEGLPQASINPVITVTSMQSARLIEIYNDFKTFSKPENYSMCEVLRPDMLNPIHLPQPLKDRYLKEWNDFVETLPEEEHHFAHEVGDFTVAMLSSPDRDEKEWDNFCRYTDRLDEIFGKRVFDYFPEWEEYWTTK